MDVLSSLVSFLRLRGDRYGRLALAAPFGLRFHSEAGHYFLVLKGSARLVMAGNDHILKAGDFVFIPSADHFTLLSAGPETPAIRDLSDDDERAYQKDGVIRTEGDPDTGCDLLAGCFHFAPHEIDILIDHMSGPVVYNTTADGAAPWLQALFDVVTREVSERRLGSFSIIDRLLETMLIEVLRDGMQTKSARPASWLAALNDQRIGRALHDIHFSPQENWTVAGLAKVAGMSRSSFATRFRALTGRTPMEHLARWRMQSAAHLLTNGEAHSVSEVVASVGYLSEAAFRKQFIEVFGQSPKAYKARKQSRRWSESV